jgi:hypothetical protein
MKPEPLDCAALLAYAQEWRSRAIFEQHHFQTS